MALDFVTNQEIIMAARRNLSDNVGHYPTGLAGVLEILKSDIITKMILLSITLLDRLYLTCLAMVHREVRTVQ